MEKIRLNLFQEVINMKNKSKICPKCGKEYNEHPALSRIDNKTEICPSCGVKEALDCIGMGNEEKDKVIEELAKLKDD